MNSDASTPTLADLELENRKLRRAVEELSVLNQISTAISSARSLNAIVELVVHESVRHLNVEQGAVMLLQDETEADPFRTMVRKAYSGSEVVPYRFGQQLTGWMLKNQKPLIINDLHNDQRFRGVEKDFPIRSLLSVPLRAKGKMVGLLNVFNSRSPDGFTREDQKLLSIIASQSAQTVETARLYQELQQRSEELQRSEAKYRAVMQEAGEAILLSDLSSQRIVEVNAKAEQVTGLPREALLGRMLTDVIPVPALSEEGTVREIAEHGGVDFSNIYLESAAGPSYIDVSASLICYGDQRTLQVISHDVTERQKLAEHLKVHADELEQQVEERTRDLRDSQAQLVQHEKMAALGRLVAGIAHEMNTPIGTINSNADILNRSLAKIREIVTSDTCPDAVSENKALNRVLKLVDEIARINQMAAGRIVAIVSSLRNFARLDEADFKEADLHEGLDSTLTLVHHELKNRIEVRKEYGDIPHIRCHPNQINQVFMNLLVNAAQAIDDKGTITIRTFNEDNTVHVAISDSGVGIPPDNLRRIFDPGFTTKGVGVGTGLGLSICFKIVQDHGGRIDVTSEVGKGSTFTVRLPHSLAGKKTP